MENSNYSKGNLLRLMNWSLIIRNDAIREKYLGGVERLWRRYNFYGNDLLSVKWAKSQHEFGNILVELKYYGFSHTVDYFIHQEPDFNEELFVSEIDCGWLLAYKVDTGYFISFIGYGRPHYLVEVKPEIFVWVDIIFTKMIYDEYFTSCPSEIADIPTIEYVYCEEPYMGESLGYQARHNMIPKAKSLAFIHEANVYIYSGYEHPILIPSPPGTYIVENPKLPEGAVIFNDRLRSIENGRTYS